MSNVAECVIRLNARKHTIGSARHAVRLYPKVEYADPKSVNHLRRAWMRAVQSLGTHWVFHPVHTVSKQRGAVTGDMVVFIIAMIGWAFLILQTMGVLA